MKTNTLPISIALLSAFLTTATIHAKTPSLSKSDPIVSATFSGIEVKAGTVKFTVENGKNVLTLSSDFVSPKAPSAHWQVVDSENDVFTLQRLDIKGDKFNRHVVLPTYIHDVASVRIYCTWAEVNLGEAKFATPIKIMTGAQK